MKKVIIILVVGIAGVGAVIVGMGWFPVARVEGATIYYRDLKTYMKAGELFRTQSGAPPSPPGEDIKRAMLEELIIRGIVKNSSSEFGETSINEEVHTYLEKLLSSVNRGGLTEAAAKLYGMSLDDFKERVMIPQLREVVVRKRVEASGKDYAVWLEERARGAQVSIYFLPYRWSGTSLEKK